MKRDGSRYLHSEYFGLPLTKREQHIRDLTASGLAAVAVAAQLGISFRTVETHRQRVFGKLGVRNPAELVAKLKDEQMHVLSQRVLELEMLVEALRAEVAALQLPDWEKLPTGYDGPHQIDVALHLANSYVEGYGYYEIAVDIESSQRWDLAWKTLAR